MDGDSYARSPSGGVSEEKVQVLSDDDVHVLLPLQSAYVGVYISTRSNVSFL